MEKENIKKAHDAIRKKQDKREIEKQKLIKQIQEESKEQLLPTLREKTKEMTDYIVKLLESRGKDNVNNIQI